MTPPPVVELSTVNNNSSFHNYPNPADNQTMQIYRANKHDYTISLFVHIYIWEFIILTITLRKSHQYCILFVRHVQYAWMIFKTRRKSAFVDVDMLIITSESITVLDHAVQPVMSYSHWFTQGVHVSAEASKNNEENWRCSSAKPEISETLLVRVKSNQKSCPVS